MQISNSSGLNHAVKLNSEGQVEEALQIVKDLEKKGELTPEINLECQLLKGILYFRLENYDDALRTADQAFKEGQKLGKNLQSIDALLIKSLTVFKYHPPFEIKKLDEIKGYITQIEKFLKSLISETLVEIKSREGILELVKGYSLLVMGEYNKGLEVYENGLAYIESIEKSDRWTFSVPFFLLKITNFGWIMGIKLETFNSYIFKLEEEDLHGPRDLLNFYLVKAYQLNFLWEARESLLFCEKGLKKSKELKNQVKTIYFLINKSYILTHVFNLNEAEEVNSHIDDFLNSHEMKIPPKELLFIKGQHNLNKGHLGRFKSELEEGLKFAIQSCEMFEKIGNHCWRSMSLSRIANLYKALGEFDKAIKYSNYSNTIKEANKEIKIANLVYNLGDIYMVKGELDLALEYLEKGLALSVKSSSKRMLIHQSASLSRIGWIYWLKGDTEQAIKHLERSLNAKAPFYEAFFRLIIIHIELGSLNKAQEYLDKAEERYSRSKIISQSRFISQVFRIAKALILKATKRIRSRAEAERILRGVYEEDIASYKYTIIALVNLCDILLMELEYSDEPEILDEIYPLVTDLVKIAKENHAYSLLAQAYLFQGRLSLLKLNLDDARQFLTQAQEIAGNSGFQLLAQQISHEHDKLLEKLGEWEKLKKQKTPISDRMNLVSLNEIIDLIMEKRAIKPPELVDEIPVLLLIIAEGGIPAFSNPFSEEFSYDEGFISNFLRGFNTFSEEIFSRGLNRATFGEYKLIMESIDSFSVCYLFKGQTYVAKHKLSQFTERLHNIAPLWQSFRDFHKTHQAILLSENPPLESLITERFIKKTAEISTST